MLAATVDDFYTTPDWELVDHFAAVYGTLKDAPRGSSDFLEAQQHLADNALAFLENCAWIMAHARHQHILFKANSPQMLLWDIFERCRLEKRPILVNHLKYRRYGASTLVALLFSFRALTQPNKRTLVLPKEKGPGKNIIKMYETFFDFLFHGGYDDRKQRYAHFQPEVGTGGRTGEKIVFGDPIDGTRGLNCEIEMMVPREARRDGTGSLARGVGAQDVHATEAAHWENFEAAVGSFMSVMPDNPDSACIFETTSSGAGSAYHTFWDECAAGDLPFDNVFVGWSDDPMNVRPFAHDEDRAKLLAQLGESENHRYGNEAAMMHEHQLTAEQLNWRRRALQVHCKGNLATWHREYPISAEEAFAQGGDHFLNASKMWLFLNNVRPPKMSGRFEGSGLGMPRLNESAQHALVRLWEDREELSQYAVVADFGTNEEDRDPTVATAYKLSEFKHVGTFCGDDNYRPRLNESTDQIVWMARYFNDALIIPERNGLGEAFIQRAMQDLGYANIISEPDWQPERFIGGAPELVRYGVPTHRGNRQAMMEALKYLFEEDEDFEIYDKQVLLECQALRPVHTPGGQARIQAPKKGKPRSANTSEQGYYDDLAMTLAIMAWIRDKLPRPKTRDELRALARKREMQREMATTQYDGRINFL